MMDEARDLEGRPKKRFLSALLVLTQPTFVRDHQANRRIIHQAATREKKGDKAGTGKAAKPKSKHKAKSATTTNRNGAAETTKVKDGLEA